MRILFLLAVMAPLCAHGEWVNLGEQDFAETWTPVSGNWANENGVIVGSTSGTEAAVLLSKSLYYNFEFQFQKGDTEGKAVEVALRAHWIPEAPDLDSTLPIVGAKLELPTEPVHAKLAARGTTITSAVDSRVVHEGNEFIGGRIAFIIPPGAEGAVELRDIRINDLGREGTWRPLFNGMDFTGWTKWGSEEWAVEDSVIVGRSGPKKSEGYLATEETWKDFRVRGTFKMLGEGNFGLFYHSTITYNDEQYPMIGGLQGEVAPGYPSPTGWVYESYKRGWLVEPDMNTYRAYALRPGEWNEIEIESQGKHVTTWVSGLQVLDLVDEGQQLTEGSFALQLHTGGTDGIRWKDLYVME